MTSTATSLAFHNHVIPLVSKFVKANETHITMSCTVNSGQDITEKCKFSVLLLNNHNVETICRCILEFQDVCHTTRLFLTQGPLKFTYFRQCLNAPTAPALSVFHQIKPNASTFAASNPRLLMVWWSEVALQESFRTSF